MREKEAQALAHRDEVWELMIKRALSDDDGGQQVARAMQRSVCGFTLYKVQVFPS